MINNFIWKSFHCMFKGRVIKVLRIVNLTKIYFLLHTDYVKFHQRNGFNLFFCVFEEDNVQYKARYKTISVWRKNSLQKFKMQNFFFHLSTSRIVQRQCNIFGPGKKKKRFLAWQITLICQTFEIVISAPRIEMDKS